jgi:hypothetical protein
VVRQLGMENSRRPAEDLWSRTLAQIPSTYGRIVHLASLRNVNTGRYEHHGLSLLFGEDDADQAMRESHARVFREWLEMKLEQQKADLDLYFSSLPAKRRVLAENWLRLRPYRGLVPAWATEAERQLFDCNLELMLGLLRQEYGA